jgi:hypothetical protein
MYALDYNNVWHLTTNTYPAQAKTSCCHKKIQCVIFKTNLEIEPEQHKCPELIQMEKRGSIMGGRNAF